MSSNTTRFQKRLEAVPDALIAMCHQRRDPVCQSTPPAGLSPDMLPQPLMKWPDFLQANGEHMELGMNRFGRVGTNLVRRGG
jgi:hypothetical protein